MSSIPKTMKGVIMEKNGGTEVLQYRTDLPVPEPKEGQILIKNDFVGINFIDTYVLTFFLAQQQYLQSRRNPY
jgi:NADPH2:quinone reductase